MTNKPLITIGITAFNAANNIHTAVESALTQNWPNTEIIIIDDASTDNTWEILATLKSKIPQIHLFQNDQNSGVASARNRIIHEAKGDFIAFFDDDDTSATNRLTKQYERIINTENQTSSASPVICHTARQQHYPDGKTHTELPIGANPNLPIPHAQNVANRILTGHPTANTFGSAATCSQMARTQTYRDLGGFDESFRRSEDTEFNIRAALSGAYFAGIATPLVTQTMTMRSDKTLQDELHYTLKYLEKHRQSVEKTSDYTFCIHWITAKYDFLMGRKTGFAWKLLKLACQHPTHTTKRILHAFPNTRFNLRSKSFHKHTSKTS